MERKEEVEAKSIWFQYFHNIKNVCPWSYESYCNGKIKITSYDKDILALIEQNWRMEPWDAVVYVVEDLTLDAIDNIVARANESQEKCEYLWSHPSYTKGGGNQAPYPIIIQQDRARLMELRYGSKKKTASG